MDAIVTIREIARILSAEDIEYLIGGSTASILYGEARTTRDVDFVVTIEPNKADTLLHALQESFYVDETAMKRSVSTGDCFNAVHLGTFFQADIFTPLSDDWINQQFARRQKRTLPGLGIEVWFASAEDTLLNKLIWFRLGREASSVQWRDAKGILKVQGNQLDQAYLASWANLLGVSDLLERAREESRPGTPEA